MKLMLLPLLILAAGERATIRLELLDPPLHACPPRMVNMQAVRILLEYILLANII